MSSMAGSSWRVFAEGGVVVAGSAIGGVIDAASPTTPWGLGIPDDARFILGILRL